MENFRSLEGHKDLLELWLQFSFQEMMSRSWLFNSV